MAMYELLIKNGWLVDPVGGRNGRYDLAIERRRVAAVETDINPDNAGQTYDAEGALVLPGLIDTHVHLSPASQAVGFHMLARAGVTTCLDCAGPVEEIIKGMAAYGCGLNVAVLNQLTPEGTLSGPDASREEVAAYVEKSLENGAYGIKLLGGHHPLSPETTAAAIETAHDFGCYAAFHCGTTKNGSNLNGMLEATALAGSNPLHICHVNAYCRGLTDGSPVEETRIALQALAEHPHLVSESHMGPYNACWARLNGEGKPRSHVVRTWLRVKGYGENAEGLLDAARDGYMRVQKEYPSEVVYLEPAEGVAHLKQARFQAHISFPVNRRSTAFLCAAEKDEQDRFFVTALSTDGGGIPRNFLLSHGLSLVKFDALTLSEFVHKTAVAPARMLGLPRKGHLTEGADADVVVVDPERQRALATIAEGKIIMIDGLIMGSGGKLITTDRGAKHLEGLGISVLKADLPGSLFCNASQLLGVNS